AGVNRYCGVQPVGAAPAAAVREAATREHDVAGDHLADGRIRCAEQQPAILGEGLDQALRDAGDGVTVEVDQDVATEDDVEAPDPGGECRVAVFGEVQVAEIHALAQVGPQRERLPRAAEAA